MYHLGAAYRREQVARQQAAHLGGVTRDYPVGAWVLTRYAAAGGNHSEADEHDGGGVCRQHDTLVSHLRAHTLQQADTRRGDENLSFCGGDIRRNLSLPAGEAMRIGGVRRQQFIPP